MVFEWFKKKPKLVKGDASYAAELIGYVKIIGATACIAQRAGRDWF